METIQDRLAEVTQEGSYAQCLNHVSYNWFSIIISFNYAQCLNHVSYNWFSIIVSFNYAQCLNHVSSLIIGLA